jgi:hypothetical protein
MTETPNPWLRAASPVPEGRAPAPGGSRWIRAFGWICVWAIVIGTPLQVAEDLELLLRKHAAMARVLAHDEPGGMPDATQLPPPWAGRLQRLALRFTTRDGREVTAAVAAHAIRPATPGTAVQVRYDPSNPALALSLRSTWAIWSSLILTPLMSLPLLSCFLRMARGAPPNAWRTYWPPLPFGR